MKTPSLQVLEILCGKGGDATTLARAGVRKLDVTADGCLTLVFGVGTFAEDSTGGAVPVAVPEMDPADEANTATPETPAEQGGEDAWDTAHLDPP